ncbi:MAG: acyltransferase family protein [Nitrospira sp.]
MRHSSIDIARGLGILLVVFGHTQIVLHEKGELFRIIFSFHLPLFFFLSGVFLKDTEAFRSLLWSKADALLKPYFVILIALGLLHSVSGRPSSAYGLGLLYATGETINTEGRDQWVALWFLPHLFVASVWCWAMIRICKRASLSPTMVACVTPVFLVLGACTIEWFWKSPLPGFGGPQAFFGKPVGLPFSVDLLLVSSAYVLAGYGMSAQVRNLTVSPLRLVCAVSLFGGLHYFFDETIDLHSRLLWRCGYRVGASLSGYLHRSRDGGIVHGRANRRTFVCLYWDQ